jgi:hypothetical protein
MGMQTDVLAGHLDVSGFIAPVGRNRVKQVTFQGSGGGGGVVEIFDTATTPTTASYGRSSALVTVTKSAHGLATGDRIGIGFSAASGASATDGNYIITVVDSSTFTFTDPNSGTVTPGTACRYVNSGARWLVSFGTSQSVTTPVAVSIPGEGILAALGIYASISNTSYVTVFYG